MRHAIRVPYAIREAVRRHVARAIELVDQRRHRQEPSYLIALATRLAGQAYSGRFGKVVFESTPVDDRGREAAESWSGADLSLTAIITTPTLTIRKAILIQAKLAAIDALDNRQLANLFEQMSLMKLLTRSPQVLEIVEEDGQRKPQIVSANRLLANEPFRALALEEYLVRRVLTTLDGDTRPGFVDAVQDSGLTELRVSVVLRGQ